MPRRERRRFAPEYKAEVVALVRSSGKTVGQVARDLDLTETAVREWVQKAEIEEGKRPGLPSPSARSWRGCAVRCGSSSARVTAMRSARLRYPAARMPLWLRFTRSLR